MAFQDVLSAPVLPALSENRQAPDWTVDGNVRDTEPTDDGVFTASRNWGTTFVPQILLIPFASGSQGATFNMRVWGWWNIGDPAKTDKVVWLPMLIAELVCTTGPFMGIGAKNLRAGDLLCDSITITSGGISVVSDNGMVISQPGVSAAWMKLDIPSPRKLQFDFKPGDVPLAFGNCFWMQTSQP